MDLSIDFLKSNLKLTLEVLFLPYVSTLEELAFKLGRVLVLFFSDQMTIVDISGLKLTAVGDSGIEPEAGFYSAMPSISFTATVGCYPVL
ncbi:hypothetical protein L6452_09367 [Arctium lappa]|uniref:Uncharacterized protein n=1 Tax=Arctium lappa TaxID=4217 RepID=A0ACB9DK57_ARCLA|nr:hypothetical protein L6452_09367 [Arctium lappa]